MPPPMPLTMPRTAAIGQLIPWSSAFWVPATAKTPSPAASKNWTGCCSRSNSLWKRKTTSPAATASAKLCQLATEAAGTAPIRTSRVMPPTTAVTEASTRTPNRSMPRCTPSAAPLIAKTKVPTRSRTLTSRAAGSMPIRA